MAKTEDLAALFRAIATADLAGATELAARIAGSEEKNRHYGAARELRAALRPNGQRAELTAPSSSVALPVQALTRVFPEHGLDGVELRPSARSELDLICREWRARSRLESHGLRPRTRLLFHGPPGCGKSLTARALGWDLDLPVMVVRFDAIVGAFLGQTAARVRQLFEFAEQTACVLLIDEVDAIGRHRGNPLDVAELDRVVIALLQELEHARPLGFIVASSNLPKQLDQALWRRFDANLAFPKPHQRAIQAFARRRARERGLEPTRRLNARIARARNFSDAERAVEHELRLGLLGAGD